ncbi:ABC transporter ATP-binding protein [Brevibacillus laterosporus]|uniref:ABC transporter ATP-binding protein n=1 Tax=Brevibacillus laterosporus TaxID=1465 RepID=UPI003D20A6BE
MGNQIYAIQVSAFTKRYGDITSVKDVNLQICKGEIFGILGPNGAGKTTTIECIVGLRQPTSGRIQIFQWDAKKDSTNIKKIIGVQPQEANLLPNLTVLETLKLFSSFYENSLSPKEIISQIGLEGKADTLVQKLSGGQKQRLLVAVALIANPMILFLDEPSSSLDPKARRHLWESILAFREEGRTVILTTHSMEEAEVLCDRVVIMNQGKTIALGTPDELIEQHCPRKIIQFDTEEICDINLIRSFQEIEEATLEVVSGKKRVALVSIESDITLKRLCKGQLNLHNWSNLSIRRGNLEDVFLALTGQSLKGVEV